MMKRIAEQALTTPALPLRDVALHDALSARHERIVALAGLEDELVELLICALSRLVEEELRVAPEHVRAIARSELSRLGQAQRIALQVHPDDVAHVQDLVDASAPDLLSIEVDPALSPGDCTFDSDLGTIDARMRTKLDRLAALIRESPTS